MSAGAVVHPREARIGQIVAHYRVLRAIGGGGMGDVYEAEDIHLGRRVALKFLSSTREQSPLAEQRFEREARAASALNHRHICTVYEIGEHAGERFIAMELLDGESLRDRLARGPLDVPSLLTIAVEVADALDAAHRAHVIHRDVSPSNVFIGRDGHAKLLDFGLAKQEGGDARSKATPDEASTMSLETLVTSPGVVLGTVAYMSPEQVRGEPLDTRTDLFSFGAVLYEMATARRAFRGKTTALVFDAVLHADPPPVATVNSSLPPDLQPILDRALEKDRRLRYHTADEFRTDLERLRRDLEANVTRPRARPTRRRWMLAVGLAVLVGAAAATYVLWHEIDKAMPSSTPRQVTSGSGLETDPAISPDGKTIAYTSDESGNQDIWLTSLGAAPPRPLTTHTASDTAAAWFPDGRGLVFVSTRRGQPDVWWARTLDERAATLLVDDAQSPDVSPDGRHVAFVRLGPGGFTRVAITPVAEPTRVRVLTTDRDGIGDHRLPRWSPDGRRIAYATGSGLWVVATARGEPVALTAGRFDDHPVWSPTGRFVYFTSISEENVTRIWRVRSDGTSRQAITVGGGAEVAPDLSRDGRTLAFSTDSTRRDIAVIDRATGRVTTFGSARDEVEPAFSPDARAVYFVSERFGAPDLWVQPLADGRPAGSPRRLYDRPGIKLYPDCSPDGRWLAYYTGDGEISDIWVGPTSSGQPLRITEDGGSTDPVWSPDGGTLAYISDRDGKAQIWTQPMRDGKPQGVPFKVTSGSSSRLSFPTWSPDGSRLAYLIGGINGAAEVGVIPAAGGRPAPITNGSGAMRVRWDTASDVLLVSGLWGTPSYQLRAIRADGTSVDMPGLPLPLGRDVFETLFDVSHDGRLIVTTESRNSGHVWILQTDGRSY